jgi:hypothetical protein
MRSELRMVFPELAELKDEFEARKAPPAFAFGIE